MTFNLTIPVQQQPVLDTRGCMSIPWYRYFQNAQSTNNNLISIPNGKLLGNDSGQNGMPGPISIGQGLVLSGGTLSALAGAQNTDQLPEGLYHLYFTTLRAQDAVGSIFRNTGSITFSYMAGTSIKAQADLFYLMATR